MIAGFRPVLKKVAACVSCRMLRYSAYDKTWDRYREKYKWHKLSDAAKRIAYRREGEAHGALADTRATRAIWHWPDDKKAKYVGRVIHCGVNLAAATASRASNTLRKRPFRGGGRRYPPRSKRARVRWPRSRKCPAGHRARPIERNGCQQWCGGGHGVAADHGAARRRGKYEKCRSRFVGRLCAPGRVLCGEATVR